jgi:hypothetical protein
MILFLKRLSTSTALHLRNLLSLSENFSIVARRILNKRTSVLDSSMLESFSEQNENNTSSHPFTQRIFIMLSSWTVAVLNTVVAATTNSDSLNSLPRCYIKQNINPDSA